MLIEQHLVQAAILDVNLTDRDVTPVPELLIEGGVPLVQRLARRWQPPTDGGHYCHGRRDRCRRRKKAPHERGRRFMQRETRATNWSCPQREFARVRGLFADLLNPLLGSRFVSGLCFFHAVEGDDDNRAGGGTIEVRDLVGATTYLQSKASAEGLKTD
jgi:hypothetical protein